MDKYCVAEKTISQDRWRYKKKFSNPIDSEELKRYYTGVESAIRGLHIYPPTTPRSAEKKLRILTATRVL